MAEGVEAIDIYLWGRIYIEGEPIKPAAGWAPSTANLLVSRGQFRNQRGQRKEEISRHSRRKLSIQMPFDVYCRRRVISAVSFQRLSPFPARNVFRRAAV